MTLPEPTLFDRLIPEFERDSSAGGWVVALSGGSDSVALLHLASLWRDRGGPALRAVHVHHGLTTSADDWVDVCHRVCDQMSVVLTVHRVTVPQDSGRGVEAAARTARYAVFRQALKGNETLLLAHHADDQVETVLQRLLRGTGPRGMAGMPRRRRLGVGGLSRPLLNISRSEISAWVQSEALEFVTDPSNEDPRFDRGFLRTEIIPKLTGRWPRFQQTVARAAELQAEFLAAGDEIPLALEENVLGEPALALPATGGSRELAGLLHRWLSQEGLQAPSAARLREFARQCREAADDRQPELILQGFALRCWRGQIALARANVPVAALPGTVTAGRSESGDWGALAWVEGGESPGFSPGEVLTLRYRQAGESLTPLGARTRDFGTLCQEHHIPPWWRERMPLLMSGGEPVFAPLIGPLAGMAGRGVPPDESLLPLWQPIVFAPAN